MSDVSSIRKGIDCVYDFTLFDVNQFFYKNAQEKLQSLVEKFKKNHYFCPKCEIELLEQSVLCEKCLCWYHKKCATNVGPGPWYCDTNRCKI